MNIRHHNLLTVRFMSGIYSISKKDRTRAYVGQAVNFRLRWAIHLASLKNGTHHSSYLQRAWDKHGKNNFQFEVLEEIECKRAPDILQETKTLFFEREQFWMDALKNKGIKLYNLSDAAMACVGRGVSEETRAAISANHKAKGIKPSLAAFHKSLIAMKGRMQSPEERKRRSDAAKGRVFDAAWRAALSASQKNKPKSAAQIEKFKATFAAKKTAKLAQLKIKTDRLRSEKIQEIERGLDCEYGCGQKSKFIIHRKPSTFRGCCSTVPQRCPKVFWRLQQSRGY